MRLESILLGKGAKSVVVMPDSMFLGPRYSRTAPPFRFLLPVPVTHTSGHPAPPVRYLQMDIYCRDGDVMRTELDGLVRKSWMQEGRCCLNNEE